MQSSTCHAQRLRRGWPTERGHTGDDNLHRVDAPDLAQQGVDVAHVGMQRLQLLLAALLPLLTVPTAALSPRTTTDPCRSASRIYRTCESARVRWLVKSANFDSQHVTTG